MVQANLLDHTVINWTRIFWKSLRNLFLEKSSPISLFKFDFFFQKWIDILWLYFSSEHEKNPQKCAKKHDFNVGEKEAFISQKDGKKYAELCSFMVSKPKNLHIFVGNKWKAFIIFGSFLLEILLLVGSKWLLNKVDSA